jgi:hypothetical protein
MSIISSAPFGGDDMENLGAIECLWPVPVFPSRFADSTIYRLYLVDSHLPHRYLAAFPAMSLAPVAPFNDSTIHVTEG